jgi:hypothetical protein
MENSKIQKTAMIEALEKSLGIVTSASKMVGISRDKHYYWMTSDPQYKSKVEELLNLGLDFAESKLFENIKNGSDTAIIFYLKTKGKNRGYIERSELKLELETPIFTGIDLDVPTDNGSE